MIRRLTTLFLSLLVTLGVAATWSVARAQDDESDERGAFTRYVEQTISTPDRQIRLGTIDGVLSSDVRISTITVADREGVWLTIENARLIWSRLALLRGRLDIDVLEAESIVVSRPPRPPEATTPNIAAREEFTLPDLPVEILIDRLTVPEVRLEEPVIGEAVLMSVDGAVSLVAGELDSRLTIERIDDRPGQLSFVAAYSDETEQLDLDLTLEEPANGVLANLLNIPDRPAVAFTIRGSGPLDSFAADISLAADGAPLVSGAATISAEGGGYRFVSDLSGSLGPLFPAVYAPYVTGTSTLEVDAWRGADGSIRINRADIVSGVARLRFAAELAPDGFPVSIDLDGTLADAAGEPVPLPGSAGTASVRAARFSLDFGADDQWSARFDLVALDTATVDAGRAVITAEGAAINLRSPETRQVTAAISGTLADVTADDPELNRALGGRFDLTAQAAWTAGLPVDVELVEIVNPNGTVRFAGTVDGLTLNGQTSLIATDVAPFAGLAGQPLSGAITFDSRGTIGLATGAFDLILDADARNLSTGMEALDALLSGVSRLSGRAARRTDGLRFDELSVVTEQLDARINGTLDGDSADLRLVATLDDAATISDRVSGPLTIEATVGGTGRRPVISAALTSPALDLQGRRLTDGNLGFDGAIDFEAGTLAGAVAVTGMLDGVAIDGRADVAVLEDGGRVIDNLVFEAPGTTAQGSITLTPSNLAAGRLQVRSTDLAAVAPLALIDAAGAIDADITLDVVDGTQSVRAVVTASGFRVETVSVGEASANVAVDDLYGVPRIDGTVSATVVRVGETLVNRLDATARHETGTTRFDIGADLAAGRLDGTGALTAVDGGYDLAIDTLRLERSADLAATLVEPVTVSVRGETITIPRAEVAIEPAGRIVLEGTVAETLALLLDIEALPVSLADAVRPDLGATGTLNGSVQVSGTAAAPIADFDVRATAFSIAPTRDAGLPPLAVEATGRYADDVVTIDASASGGDLALTISGRAPVTAPEPGRPASPLDLTVDVEAFPLSLVNVAQPELGADGTMTGTVALGGTTASPTADFALRATGFSLTVTRGAGLPPLGVTAEGRFADGAVTIDAAASGGDVALTIRGLAPVQPAAPGQPAGPLDLTVDVQSLPLSVANAVQPDLGATGALTGTAAVTGTISAPVADFNVRATGVSVEQLRQVGVPPLVVEASGRYAGDTVSINATATGAGVSISVDGDVPLTGGGLDLRLNGQVPLGLADQLLADRGARFTGTASVSLQVGGSLAAPSATGSIAVDNAAFSDPATATQLTGITLRASLDGQSAVIQQLSGTIGGRGRVSASGSIGIAPGSGFPADIAIVFDNARFTDGRIISADVAGNLRVTGPLLTGPTLSGVVNVDRAEITVPETLPRTATFLDVRHRLPPPNVQRTLERVRRTTAEAAARATGAAGLNLDVTINAPNRIFVRGRGIDAELGGSVRVTGPISDIQPVGEFRLIRGRVVVIGQRINFDRGSVTLVGNLDPSLDFVASTSANNITVTAQITGVASDPQIVLSSVPDLPQDEVLAQLLFGRSLGDLSPLQLASLAAGVAELAGAGSGPGLLGSLRQATGLDDLEIVTDENGGTAVQAGRYITDNVYLGVRTGAGGQTSVSVNLDITDDLTVRAEVGPQSGSKVGVFYEREY